MSLTAACPNCSKTLKLPSEDYFGKVVKCPACGEKFRLTAPPTPAKKAKPSTADPTPTRQNKPKPEKAAARTAPENNSARSPQQPTSKKGDDPKRTPENRPAPQTAVAAPVGLEARYVLDDAPSAATPAAPSSMEMPVFAPPSDEAPAFDFASPDAGAVGETTAEQTSADSIETFRAKRAKRKKKSTIVGVAAAAVLAIVGGTAVAFLPSGDQQVAVSPSAGPSNTTPKTIATSLNIESPTRGEAIPTTLLPPGVGILMHLRPAEIWNDGASIRSTLSALPPSLMPWAKATVSRLTGRDPSQIEELTVGFVLGARGVPPEVALVVRTTEPKELGALIQEFPGEIDRIGEMRLIKDDERGIFIKDESTFAICPVALADDLAEVANTPTNYLTDAIIDIVEQTDRDRLASFVFGVEDLNTHGPALLPEEVLSFAQSVVKSAENPLSVAWSVHATDRLYLESVLQPPPTVTPVAFEQSVLKAINAAPQDMVSKLKRQQLSVAGVRDLVGRFPAMLEAARLSSDIVADSRNGVVDVRTSLPLIAGPNIALASVLTYNVLSGAPSSVAVAANDTAPVQDNRTIEQKLLTEVDGEFQRTPLQEALAYLAEEGNIDLEIDGDALKLAGYTKNMAQTFQMGTVTIREALRQIIVVNKYDKMCVAIDPEQKKLVVLTYQVAEQRGLTPIEFE